MKKGYHKGQELTMSELGLSLEELAGQPLELFAREARLGRGQVLHALMLVRQAMASDISSVFEGMVEIDETYLGGAWRNKRKSDRSKGAKRGRIVREGGQGDRLLNALDPRQLTWVCGSAYNSPVAKPNELFFSRNALRKIF